MGIWAAIIPSLISAGGSLLAANQNNSAIDEATNATRQTNADNIKMLSGMALQDQQDNLPIQQQSGSARNLLAALSGVGQMQKDLTQKNYLQEIYDGVSSGNSESGGGTSTGGPPIGSNEDSNVIGSDAYKAEIKSKGLMPSLLGEITSSLGLNYVDPSLLHAVSTGNVETWATNMLNPLASLFRDNNRDAPWKSANENISDEIDWNRYLTDNPDIVADKLSQRDANYIAANGGDFDGDGFISDLERAMNHYNASGSGEGRKTYTLEETAAEAAEAKADEEAKAASAANLSEAAAFDAALSGVGATSTEDANRPDYVLSADGQYETFDPATAYEDIFLNSGRAKSFMPQAEYLQDNILGGNAAVGKLFSGTTANAVADNLVSNYTAPAYNAYVNDLSNLAGTAQTLMSDTSGTTNSIVNQNTQSGNATSLAALNKTSTYGAALQGAATGWANSGGYTS